MPDLKLDSSGDLEILDGLLNLTSTVQEDTTQRLKIKLSTHYNEWYLDLSVGIPYLKTILKKGVSKSLIDSIFRSAIQSDPEISSITSFNSNISERIYTLTFKAITNSGEIINLTETIEV